LEGKEGLGHLCKIVKELSNSYENLLDDNDRKVWIDKVINEFYPIMRKMEVLLEENDDKIRFVKKYIF